MIWKKQAGRVLPARLGFLDQGVIFTCAAAEDYVGCSVLGIILTARCDIAHAKTPSLSYLPIVRLHDWLHRDFARVFVHRQRAQLISSLRDCLTRCGFSATILLSQHPQAVADVLFPENAENRLIRRSRRQVHRLARQLSLLNQAGPGSLNDDTLAAWAAEFSRPMAAVLRECAEQRLSGYYFLPEVEPHPAEEGGHVVLLRQIRHIPRDLAGAMASGLSGLEYAALSAQDDRLLGQLSFDCSDFAMPVGLLRSPEVEHLAQEFAVLYTRIGVEDLRDGYLNDLVDQHFPQHFDDEEGDK